MKTFTITDEQWDKIAEWQNKHIKEKHPNSPIGDAIDSRFTYEFTPTTIGTIGVCRCSCRNSFIFLEV